MKQLFKGQTSCKAVFSKQAWDSYYYGILAATVLRVDSGLETCCSTTCWVILVTVTAGVDANVSDVV